MVSNWLRQLIVALYDREPLRQDQEEFCEGLKQEIKEEKEIGL